MFFSQQLNPKHKTPFTSKLALVFWITLSLALLSFFAFGIVLIALIVGAILFTTNLFQNKKKPDSIPYADFKNWPYSKHRNMKKDDDVIDI